MVPLSMTQKLYNFSKFDLFLREGEVAEDGKSSIKKLQ